MRAEKTASFLNGAVTSVLDLGASEMILKTLLPEDVAYYPVDDTSRCAQTIVCDFNRHQFPEIRADAVFLDGCLENTEDAAWLLKQSAESCEKEIILSYHPTEKTPDRTMRRNRSWVNDYSSKELVQAVQRLGFLLTALYDRRSPEGADEVLYKFEKAKPALLPRYEFCTGCGACGGVCPSGAIAVKPDAAGFLRPVFSEEKCIGCGKCLRTCPSLHPQYKNSREPECYAVWADDAVREQSSSGGTFTLLAEEIFRRDGFVCGAAWTEDFHVKHVLIRSAEELGRLRHSKYLQSDAGGYYPEIKDLLERGETVLFSGCPCQAAGLYAFLGKDYEKLYTVDLLCHYAPPDGVFRKYLQDNYGIHNLTSVEFRPKKYGWDCTTVLITGNGGKGIKRDSNDDYFEKGFHSRLFMSPACEHCQFADTPRQGDLTIGDYWWCKSADRELDDNKGTSTVLVNSPKGAELFEKIRPGCKLCSPVPLENNRKTNRLSMPFAAHPGRDRFYDLIGRLPFNKAVDYALGGKYDVGIVGDWSVENFGANLTYYALYRVVRGLGYEPLMIERPADVPWKPNSTPACFRTNPYRPYDLAPLYATKRDMKQLSERCGTFLVGSDQLFNDNLNRDFGEFITLDWMKNSRKKIAYGASFGADYFWGTEETRARMSFFMKQFDAFSVREKSGVDLAKKDFGVPAEWVLDPVFLCDRKYYDELAQKSQKRQPEKYLGVYMLDPDQAKADAVRFAADRLHLPCRAVSDAAYSPDEIRRDWDVETDPTVFCEDLLREIRDCDFWVTDSFHGVCLAVIFHKPFIAIANKGRGLSRFTSILGLLGLTDRLVFQPEEIRERPDLFGDIGYARVDERLNGARQKSLSWLSRALEAEKKLEFSSFDILTEQMDRLENRTDAKFGNVDEYAKGVNARLDAVDEYARGVNARLDAVDEYAKSVNARFDAVDEYAKSVNARLDAVGEYARGVNARLDAADESVRGADQRFRDMDRRLEAVENRLDAIEKNLADLSAYIDYLNSRTVRFQVKKHFPGLWNALKRLKR